MSSSMCIRKNQGFTLVELMVVIAIIGILAAVGVPKLINYVKTAETEEAVEMSGRINKALVGFVGSRIGVTSVIVGYLDGTTLTSTTGSSLQKLIPTLSLPPNATFDQYEVFTKTTDGEMFSCIKATRTDTSQYIVFSSSLVGNVAGWENYVNRDNYLTGAATAAGGSCAANGADTQ